MVRNFAIISSSLLGSDLLHSRFLSLFRCLTGLYKVMLLPQSTHTSNFPFKLYAHLNTAEILYCVLQFFLRASMSLVFLLVQYYFTLIG
jgi:hypothetical protein